MPHAANGWDVNKGGAAHSNRHFDKKRDAVDAGVKISLNQGTQLYNGKDGKNPDPRRDDARVQFEHRFGDNRPPVPENLGKNHFSDRVGAPSTYHKGR